jgi:hypothetical protein
MKLYKRNKKLLLKLNRKRQVNLKFVNLINRRCIFYLLLMVFHFVKELFVLYSTQIITFFTNIFVINSLRGEYF